MVRKLKAAIDRRVAQFPLTINDIIVLRICAETVLSTNKALSPFVRRTLRLAADRAKRHVERRRQEQNGNG